MTQQSLDGAISRMVQAVTAAPLGIGAEIERFHAVRSKTLTILCEVTPAQALWSPTPGVWSIAQNADHLLRSEELYREQIVRVIGLAQAGKGTTVQISLREVNTFVAFIPAEMTPLFEFPMRVFNFFMPSALRELMVRYPLVAARNPNVSEPRSGLTSEKLAVDLAASMVETEKVFSGPLPPNVEELTIDHPILGNNTIAQMVRIMTAHEERHQGQMAGVRANPKFPTVGNL
jgi:hypothetical protein